MNVLAFFPLNKDPKISDAKSGTGQTENVWNALLDGFSTTESALPLIIYAKPGMLLEHAPLVIKDTKFKMESAFFAIVLISHKIWVAKPGTGKSKFVTNALTNGTTRKDLVVFPETHCVKLQVITVPALIVTKVMI